jgi:hypothetical protein
MSDNKKVYQPKDATKKYQPKQSTESQEEKKTSKPQSQNEGGKPRSQPSSGQLRRPETAKPDDRKGEDRRGGAPRGRGGNQRTEGGDREQRQRPAENKDSWVYKFNHIELPKYESVDVTLDTEVPALPSKEDIIKQPSKDVFDEKMAALDN